MYTFVFLWTPALRWAATSCRSLQRLGVQGRLARVATGAGWLASGAGPVFLLHWRECALPPASPVCRRNALLSPCSPNKERIPHGMIFACFMVSSMVGSALAGRLLSNNSK